MTPGHAPWRTGWRRPGWTRPSSCRRSGCGGRRSCRDVQGAGHLLGLQAAGRETDDLGFPLGQPGRTLDLRGGWPAASTTARTMSEIQPSGSGLSDQHLNSLLRRQRGAMGPRLRHRMKRVGSGEEPGGRGQRGRRDSAVVATPVEPFVVVAGDLGQGGEERGTGEDPFRVVGVQPDLLPFTGREQPRFQPDTRRHRNPPQSCRCAARLTRSTSARSNRQRSAAETASFATPAECPD